MSIFCTGWWYRLSVPAFSLQIGGKERDKSCRKKLNRESYRNQGNKATEKPNCYQKVIICPSEPRRLIFDYCGAIFALPEAFFFGYSGAIFERSKVSFH